MSKNFNGYLFALFAIFFWSFNVIYAKILANRLSPFEISFIRWVIPALLFLPFTIKQIIIYKKQLLSAWRPLLIMTLTGLGFQNTLVYFAGYTSNAIDMALIGATSPIFMLIFSGLFLHQKITITQILGILTAIFGVTIVILDGNIFNFAEITLTKGDFYMLFSSVTFAFYAIAQKKLPAGLPQMPAFCVMICVSSLMFLPLAAYDYAKTPHILLHKNDLFILFVLAVFNSGLAYVFWNNALDKIGTVKTGAMYYLMPVFSAIEAYFILNERIYPNQIYGTFLIIGGIILNNLDTAKTNRPSLKRKTTDNS